MRTSLCTAPAFVGAASAQAVERRARALLACALGARQVAELIVAPGGDAAFRFGRHVGVSVAARTSLSGARRLASGRGVPWPASALRPGLSPASGIATAGTATWASGGAWRGARVRRAIEQLAARIRWLHWSGGVAGGNRCVVGGGLLVREREAREIVRATEQQPREHTKSTLGRLARATSKRSRKAWRAGAARGSLFVRRADHHSTTPAAKAAIPTPSDTLASVW